MNRDRICDMLDDFERAIHRHPENLNSIEILENEGTSHKMDESWKELESIREKIIQGLDELGQFKDPNQFSSG